MKKILIITLATFCNFSFAQEVPCENNVSTDHNAPTNSSLPIPYDGLFLNNFNWVPFTPQGSLGRLQTIGIQHLGSDQFMNPLYRPPLSPLAYYQYLRDELIMPTGGQGGFIPNHQNGWELIGVNLGFFPDGTPYNDIPEESNRHNRIPYVILYHRYLSKIRVFANIGDEWANEHAYDAVRIRLTLNGGDEYRFNGLFRLQNGMDQSLDQKTIVTSIGATAEAPNDKQNWFSADFTVAYDPCVCDYPSAINLSFELVKKNSFELHGRGITLTEDIVDVNGNLVANDFFTNFGVDSKDSEKNFGGFIIYEKMEGLYDDYISKMEAYNTAQDNAGNPNTKLKRDLAIIKWVQFAIKEGITIATGGTASTLLTALSNYAADIVGIDPANSKAGEVWELLFKEAEKIIGGTVATYINDNFKEDAQPTMPEKPTANFTEMYFKGKLTQNDSKPGPTIYTPGTYGNSITNDLEDQHHYPVYNEALGVFALLERPKINISRSFKNYDCYNYASIPFPSHWRLGREYGDSANFYTAQIEEEIQIELAEDLKYAFNGALQIKDHSIEASFVIVGSAKRSNNRLEMNGIHTNQIVDIHSLPSNNINIESINFNINDNETYFNPTLSSSPPFLTGNFKDLEFQTINVPIDALNNTTFSFGLKKVFKHPNNLEDITQREYMFYPNSIFADCWALDDLMKSDQVPAYIIDSAYLKVIVNVTFEGEKSDGSPHEYTYMYTYKVHPDDLNDDFTNLFYPNLPGSPGDFGQFPENLFLDGLNFDGSQIDGCQLNDTVYTCKAWNNITLSGVFSIANGYDVFIDAGNEVIVLPESFIPAEMVRQIVPVLDFSNPMPPADETYVRSFCNKDNDNYQAYDEPSNMPILNNDSTIVYEEDVRDIFAFNIFPNPTSGSSTVSITLNESAKGDLFITDMNGRTLGTAFRGQTLRGGKTEHQLPTASLASGIYLVHLFVDGERHVKRLVKQ